MHFEGRPGDARLPYGTHARTIKQLFDAFPDMHLEPWVTHELARIIPHLGPCPAPITSEEEKLRFWDAKVEVMRAAIEQGGMRNMIFDDCHYIDAGSVEAGQYVFGRLGWGTPGVAYRTIHCFRKVEIDEQTMAVLQVLAGAGMVAPVELEPLEEEQVGRLVAQLELPSSVRTPEKLSHFTGGNPLFILETARSLHEADARTENVGRSLPVSDKVSAVITGRLAHLGGTAIQVARAAAVLQSDFTVELVAQVLRAPLLDVMAAWDELEAAQILKGSRFSHDLIYEAVLQGTPATIRAALHRSAARTLAEHGATAARIARNYVHGMDAVAAVPWLVSAARAAKNDFRLADAADFYEEAISFLVDLERHGDVHDLRCEQWRMFSDVMDTSSQADVEERMIATERPALVGRAYLLRSQRLTRGGETNLAREAWVVALRHATLLGDPTLEDDVRLNEPELIVPDTASRSTSP